MGRKDPRMHEGKERNPNKAGCRTNTAVVTKMGNKTHARSCSLFVCDLV